MKTAWTSSRARGLVVVLVAGLVALPGPTLAQPVEEDEETVLIRPTPPADDEETVLVRPSPTADGDDEETTLLHRSPPPKPAGPTTLPSFATSRFSGYFFEKLAFDTAHDGEGEDVFDFRTRFSLGTEITTTNFLKVVLSGRFSHFVVGEDAGDETWALVNSNNVKWDFEAELHEAYIYWPNDILNIRVGNQIVRWGYGQFNKPSDVLNPMDYREGLFADLEVPLVPVFMVHVDRTIGPLNVSGVYQPFFAPNRANLFGQDWAPLSAMSGNPAFATVGSMAQISGLVGSLFPASLEDRVQPLLLATHPPEERLENGQFGTRLGTRLGGVDLSLSYFYGWDKLPFVAVNEPFMEDVGNLATAVQEHPAILGVLQGMSQLDPFDPLGSGAAMLGALDDLSDDDKLALQAAMQAANRLLFDADGAPRELSLESIFATRYRRQHTVGLSGSTILFDRIGLKVDSAFSPARTIYLESGSGFPLARSLPTISYSVGLDYRLGSWFDILGEFYHFHVLDLEPGEEVFVIGSDLYMVTLATHLRVLDFDALEFQLAGMFEIAMQNLFLFPKATYTFPNGIHVAAGAVVAEVLGAGDAMGPAGLFDRNDMIYAEFKWAF